jgi:hypothetical protein
MIRNIFLKFIPITVSIFIIIQCTENPFFDDEISQDDHTVVSGKVLLSDRTNPDNIYVWLEGFNISTFTDEEGNFEIEIPQPRSQSGGGLNGIFNLYYFTANYEFQTSSILLINGSIQYSKGDVNGNGQISETIVLTKMLDIEMSVAPAQIQAAYKDPLNFTVKLKNLIDTVVVKTHYNQWGVPSSFVIMPEGGTPEEAFFLQGQPGDLREANITEETFWVNSFLFSPNFFSAGTYQIWPYIQIVQEGLPYELLNSIDEDIYTTTFKYLQLPIKLQRGILKVTEL